MTRQQSQLEADYIKSLGGADPRTPEVKQLMETGKLVLGTQPAESEGCEPYEYEVKVKDGRYRVERTWGQSWNRSTRVLFSNENPLKAIQKGRQLFEAGA